MYNKPLISVIMPVYNTEKYIREAIESILTQTYKNFEFIIIDDASTDASVEIAKSYNDPRINLIIKPQNTGYTESLNMAIKISKGEYIARMDSDDISLPERLERQLNFMEEHLEVSVCGTWYKIINQEQQIKYPSNHNDIKVGLLQYCNLAHPTVMIRKKILEEYNLTYDKDFEPAEDYRLWTQLSRVSQLANIPEVLFHYRLHTAQVSTIRSLSQLNNSNRIRIDQLSFLGITPDEGQRNVHLCLINGYKGNNYKAVFTWLELILKTNFTSNYYNPASLKKLIRTLWQGFIYTRCEYNVKIFLYDIRSNFSLRYSVSKMKYAEFIMRCFLAFFIYKMKKYSLRSLLKFKML